MRLLVLGSDMQGGAERERRQADAECVISRDEREELKEERRAELAERRDEHPCAWWLPYGCKAAGAVRSGGVIKGGPCNSRGCLWCHRAKLAGHVSGASLMPTAKDETATHIRFTPIDGRPSTRADVRRFLERVRALFTEWEREHGLGACWWVAEVVEKPDEPSSRIPCPRRKRAPGRWTWRFSREARELVDNLHTACEHGRCNLCDGSGWLPAVHLHVHAVVHAPAFWWGDHTREDEAQDFYQFRNGEGFVGFYQRHGLGHSKAELIRSAAGTANYIAKAPLVYITKLTDGGKERSVDYAASQRACELASAVYGNERHRGTKGRAYGMRMRSRDAGALDGWVPGEAPGDERGAATAAHWGTMEHELREAKARQLAAELLAQEQAATPSQLMEIATVGKRAAAAANLRGVMARLGIVDREARQRFEAVEVARLGGLIGESLDDESRERATREGRLPLEGRPYSPALWRDDVAAMPAAFRDWRPARSAIAALPLGDSVPKETQVVRTAHDGGKASGRPWVDNVEHCGDVILLIENESGSQPLLRSAPLVTEGYLTPDWRRIPCVRADDWWFQQVPDGLLVGRGAVCTLLPGETQDTGLQWVQRARKLRRASSASRDYARHGHSSPGDELDLWPYLIRERQARWCAMFAVALAAFARDAVGGKWRRFEAQPVACGCAVPDVFGLWWGAELLSVGELPHENEGCEPELTLSARLDVHGGECIALDSRESNKAPWWVHYENAESGPGEGITTRVVAERLEWEQRGRAAMGGAS